MRLKTTFKFALKKEVIENILSNEFIPKNQLKDFILETIKETLNEGFHLSRAYTKLYTNNCVNIDTNRLLTTKISIFG